MWKLLLDVVAGMVFLIIIAVLIVSACHKSFPSNKILWTSALSVVSEIGAAWRGEIPIEIDSIAPFIDPIDDSSNIIDTTNIKTLGTSKVSEPHTGASQSTVARRSGTNGVVE